VFTWNRSASKNTSLLVKSILNVPRDLQTQSILNLVLEVSENFVVSPDWWEAIQPQHQSTLLRTYDRSLIENKQSTKSLIAGRPTFVDWEPLRAAYI
jgi:hypothetical protein